jgi:CspA family cold shock protein
VGVRGEPVPAAGLLPAVPSEVSEAAVPTGTVKYYDADKGFGFITSDEGDDVFVHVSTLPAGVTSLKKGTKVEFGVVDGRKGKQALSLSVLSAAPSVVKSTRKPAEDLAVILEDLIKLLDSASNQLRRGKYPPDASAHKVAAMLRAVANDLDV